MPERWYRKMKGEIPFCDYKNVTKWTKTRGSHEHQRKTISSPQYVKTFFNYKLLCLPTEKAYVTYNWDQYDYAY